MAKKDMSGKDSPKKDESAKPDGKPAKPDKAKPSQTTDDDLYDQGDIATPRRDPPYEDGI